jgi:parallel beta-helix repeat protein
VFRGAGPGAILDGSDEQIVAGRQWNALDGEVFARDTGFPSTHVSTERGRLFKYASLNDLRALRAGEPGGFFADHHHLYLKFADGSSPAAHTVHVGRLDRGFVAEGIAWIGIENLELRHFGGGSDGVGILLRHCTGCRVARCRIHEVRRAGIWIEGGERNRIEENELWDTSIFEWPWHSINQSSADNHAIFVTGRSPRGLIIRGNRIRGTFDAIAPCGNAPPAAGLTAETDVYDNDLSQLASDGIEAEPYCANLRLWGNRITAAMMAISTAPAGPGPIWAVRNVAYRFGATRGREVWLASAFKVNTFDPQKTGPVFLYHNTFVADTPSVDGIALLEPGAVAFVRARNNVIAGTRHALFSVNPIRWDGDSNNLHSTSGLPLIHWLGTPYAGIEAYRAATGQERAGFSGSPQLADPSHGDFSPAIGSPLIDRGVLLPGINDRFAGRAPDVGAIESGDRPAVSSRAQKQ